MQQFYNKTNEEIIKEIVPDWNNWHEHCREQMLEAMDIAKKQYRWQGYRQAFGTKPVFKAIPANQFKNIDWDKLNYDEYADL